MEAASCVAGTWRLRWCCFCLVFWSALAHAQAGAERVAWVWDGAQPPAWASGNAAVVVRHVLLRGDKVLLRPRHSSPGLPANARVTPVVHVQLSGTTPPPGLDHARDAIVEAMLHAAALSTSGWVQLDLEALASQRASYRALVLEIRGRLPAATRLSVTALAWWCQDARWLDGLAADEVVPMFFRMGHETERMRKILVEKPARLHARCGKAAGFSMQEPFTAIVAARYGRTYWFDNQRWKSGAIIEGQQQ